MRKEKKILMLGTDLATKGGIASVVQVYRDGGMFARYPITYLATHCDGGALAKLRKMCQAYLQFLPQLLGGRIALLHIHVASRASFWRKSVFFWLARLFRVPTILHLHGAEFAVFYGQESGPLRRWLIRAVFNQSSRIVVLSQSWKAWVQSLGTRAPVTAIYNPVILPAQTASWSARDPGRVLFLGRLGERKGSYDLLEALARLAPLHAGLRAALGGDGEVEQTAARAAELGIADRVQLLGWVRAEQKEAQLEQAGIYALPSYNEGLPMSVLEAMAAGMPVLATPVGGIPEAVTDGVEGLLVPPGDVAALAQGLGRLLADPALAQRMGTAARHKVEACFSSAAVLPQVERLYQELLGCGRP